MKGDEVVKTGEESANSPLLSPRWNPYLGLIYRLL